MAAGTRKIEYQNSTVGLEAVRAFEEHSSASRPAVLVLLRAFLQEAFAA